MLISGFTIRRVLLFFGERGLCMSLFISTCKCNYLFFDVTADMYHNSILLVILCVLTYLVPSQFDTDFKFQNITSVISLQTGLIPNGVSVIYLYTIIVLIYVNAAYQIAYEYYHVRDRCTGKTQDGIKPMSRSLMKINPPYRSNTKSWGLRPIKYLFFRS